MSCKNINKYELITAMMHIFDLLEAYQRECEQMRRDVKAAGGATNPADLLCLKVGRKKVFEDCNFLLYNHVHAERRDDGSIWVTPFEDWQHAVFQKAPDTMSKAEFLEYFDAIYHERYEEERTSALEALEAKEADDE